MTDEVKNPSYPGKSSRWFKYCMSFYAAGLFMIGYLFLKDKEDSHRQKRPDNSFCSEFVIDDPRFSAKIVLYGDATTNMMRYGFATGEERIAKSIANALDEFEEPLLREKFDLIERESYMMKRLLRQNPRFRDKLKQRDTNSYEIVGDGPLRVERVGYAPK